MKYNTLLSTLQAIGFKSPMHHVAVELRTTINQPVSHLALMSFLTKFAKDALVCS